MRRANVYCRGELAGVLSKDEAGYRFQYVPEYLAKDSTRHPAISLSFPKREAAFARQARLEVLFDALLRKKANPIVPRLLARPQGLAGAAVVGFGLCYPLAGHRQHRE